MSPISSASKTLSAWGVLLLCSMPVFGQEYLTPVGSETLPVGSLAGDQVQPALALGPSNNVVVWEDSVMDRSGSGIGIGFLNSFDYTGGTVLRVNKAVTGDQMKPVVAQLSKGEIAVAWESQATGTPDIYMRLWRKGTLFTSDIRLNSYTKDQQIDPVITASPDGGAVVAWASYGQDGDMWGIFARKVTAAGTAVQKKEFQVNQVSAYNQRDPGIATLAGGNFVVVWVSENERRFGSVDVYGRIFKPDGTALTDEVAINQGTNICSLPSVTGTADGGFTVVWAEQDSVVRTNSWDIAGRSFSAVGSPLGAAQRINTFTYGDQTRPKIAAGPTGCMVVWTSLGQDGSREGVFGRYWQTGSGPVGSELRVNTTVASQQIQPAVAWNGVDRFLVTWSGMAIGGFNLFGQQYSLISNP